MCSARFFVIFPKLIVRRCLSAVNWMNRFPPGRVDRLAISSPAFLFVCNFQPKVFPELIQRHRRYTPMSVEELR